MYMIKKTGIFFLLLVPAAVSAQQKHTISGYVQEKGSKETLPGVAIYAPALKTGTSSNSYGFFSLTLQADTVDLVISYAGYTVQKKTIILDKDISLSIDIEPVQLKEVVVEADKVEKISQETQMSSVSIPVEQIKDIPALLGEKDVLKVIQLLPGVQKGSEGSSGIYVRGGGPDQNLIILDDATVYNASHLFGFFSLFNGDALKSVELIKGGFPARYGGRLSSVLEMRMKEGSKDSLHGEAGIGVISSRLVLEGPIVRGKSSFLVSARRTYIDLLIRPFLQPSDIFGYYFYDMNAKANYVLNDKNKFYLSGYFGNDRAYNKGEYSATEKFNASLRWGNATGTARWNHQWGSRLFSNTSFIFAKYTMDIDYEDIFNQDTFNLKYGSGIRDFSLKHDFDFSPNPKHLVRFGFVSTYHRFTPSAFVIKNSSYPEGDVDSKSRADAFENAVYIEDDWEMTSRLKGNIGIRLSHFLSEGKHYFKPEPRVAMRYMLKEDLSVKGSFAMMNQYLHLLSNTGIGLPTDLWVPVTEKVGPQNSWQAAAGVAKDWYEQKLMISVEGYYKHMTDVIGYKEGASFLVVDDPDDNEEVNWENNITTGQGWSYGGELLIQRKFGKFTGWIGYTLSWTQLQFDSLNFGKKYFARYDRRHDLSLVGIYKLNDHITISGTWVYGTGNAVTLPQANYIVYQHDPTNGGTSTVNGPQQNYWWWYEVSDYGEKNSFRMAPYHRLDLGVQFHKQKKRYERTFELSVYNVYNRKNPFYYFIKYDNNTGKNTLTQVSLFPIIPSVSWTIKF
ncbi:MAG: TonB-dependent receptor plug [Bacteroidetes bacterium]|nr:MAG: TonB-dependent receptor plug [Bacteroidota bacterium]